MHSQHHRRTASDTAFINKLFAPKELKQGPSSSGNSPSNTPAFFSSSISPPLSSSQGSSISQLNKSVQDSTLTFTQHNRQQHKRVGRPHPPTFVPLYTGFSLQPSPPTATAATAAIPVLYHPQTAMVDPSWYYNPMVLYPVSPSSGSGYSYSTQYSPVVQSPVVHPYSITPPGLVGQLSGGELRHRMQASSQDSVTSPTHPGGMVIRPIPQPAVNNSMHKPEEYDGQTTPLWSPGTPTGMPLSTGMANAPLMGGGPCQPVYPGVNNVAAATQQLAEQMEKNLTFSDSNGGMFFPGGGGGQMMSNMFPPVGEGLGSQPDKSRASPIGQKQQLALMMQNLQGSGHKNNGVTAAGMYGYPSLDPTLMSPTQLGPGHQFVPSHMMGQLSMGMGPEGGGPPHLPYPSSLPLHGNEGLPSQQPPTPTMGHIPPAGHQQPAAQSIFSPPNSAMTHSPIQILGHTLSTSIFSPPPSAGPPHGLFITQPPSTGKGGIAPGSPAHPPVGSGGARLRRFDSPKQGRADHSLSQQHSQSSGLMGAMAASGGSRGLSGVEVSSGLVQQQSYGNTTISTPAVSDVPSFSQTQQLPPR